MRTYQTWNDLGEDHKIGVRKWSSPKPGIVEDIYYEHFGHENSTDDRFLFYYEIIDADTGQPVDEKRNSGGDGGDDGEGSSGSGSGGIAGNSTSLCDLAKIVKDGIEECPVEAPRKDTPGTDA